MSENARPDVSARLHRAVACLGARLADLIDASGAPLAPLEHASAFLRSMAQEAEAEMAPVALDPLDRMIGALELSDVERSLLLLAGMPDEHEGYGTVLRALSPRGEPRATAGLAMQLLASGPGERVSLRDIIEQGPLFRSGAVSLVGDGPFFERHLLPMEGLWSALHGLDVWPRVVRTLPTDVSLAGVSEWLESESVTGARLALQSDQSRLVLITADSEDVALHRALSLCRDVGVSAAAVASWPPDRVDIEQAVSVHATIRGSVLVVRAGLAEHGGSTPSPEYAGYHGPLVIAARRGAVRVQGSRPVVHVEADRLSARIRGTAWRETLAELADRADELGARYTLDPCQIDSVAADVRSLEDVTGNPMTLESVAASVRVRSNLALAGGFELRRARASADALVLPPDRQAQIREALDRLRHQRRVLDDWGFLEGRAGARGVRMLFSGPPGTGKTLAAEVMATALGVDLLVVDIPRVVSKWIGETEKNLAELFDAAERAQAVLFFDEADAFFGRRTEIADAHDRYANFETAYLLSRLERFEGLAILATNLRQNIDPAFLRRLEFLVEFDEPAAAERAAIWRCHLPPGVAIAPDVRLADLAGLYAIVGGLIRNAAVAAAFLAAADGADAVAQRHFLRAIAREYEKTGKAFPGVPAGAAA